MADLKINIELIVLSMGAIAFVCLLVFWHTDPNNKIRVEQIVADPSGKFSLRKFGQLLALLTSTWIIINQTRAGLLSDWLFTGYMLAWAGANLASRYMDKNDSNEKKNSDSERYSPERDDR